MSDTTAFDVVIIGAGVNGAVLFRDLSLQGVNCLITEKADFGAGTSAAPSRLIHGGLKYLETGEFGLVAQSTLERNLLLRNAPHCVAAVLSSSSRSAPPTAATAAQLRRPRPPASNNMPKRTVTSFPDGPDGERAEKVSAATGAVVADEVVLRAERRATAVRRSNLRGDSQTASGSRLASRPTSETGPTGALCRRLRPSQF